MTREELTARAREIGLGPAMLEEAERAIWPKHGAPSNLLSHDTGPAKQTIERAKVVKALRGCGLTEKQIAEELGLTKGQVKSLSMYVRRGDV